MSFHKAILVILSIFLVVIVYYDQVEKRDVSFAEFRILIKEILFRTFVRRPIAPPSAMEQFWIQCGLMDARQDPGIEWNEWLNIAVIIYAGLSVVFAGYYRFEVRKLRKIHWRDGNVDLNNKSTSTSSLLNAQPAKTTSTSSLIQAEAVKTQAKRWQSVKDKNHEILTLRRRIEQLEDATNNLNQQLARRDHQVCQLERKNSSYERLAVASTTGLGAQFLHSFWL